MAAAGAEGKEAMDAQRAQGNANQGHMDDNAGGVNSIALMEKAIRDAEDENRENIKV
jgi:hypothetical protein